jgi:hypothetical protein
MNKATHSPLIRALFLFVSFALALGACVKEAGPPPSPPVTPTTSPTAAPSPAAPTEAVSEPEVSAACAPIDAQTSATMRQIEGQVIRLRGLQPPAAAAIEFLTPEQLRERVEQDFLSDYTPEEARLDARTLALLGLIEPDLDLHRLYVDLLSEQVAGFYDSQDEQMLVVCGTGFGGLEIFTYAHEYVHALQDHAFDLESGLNFSEEACELDGERCFALRALIEGDASLLQEQWLRTYADQELLASLLTSLGSFDSPVLESAPEYIQAELTFPYLAGLAFTRSLYLEGDWAAVDAAFQDPPLSSEQILHPERYPRDEPIFLEPPSSLNALENGWKVTRQDVLGEWATQQIFFKYLSEEAIQKGVGGWGGDLLFLLEQSANDPAALVLITQWDTVRDTHEFAAEFMNYAEARFGSPAERDLMEATWIFKDGTSHFLRQSNQTRWIIAPDGETLSMLQSKFALPLAAAP